ncbi:fibronectin type III domain-containing protein [Oscillospiraceae bacterium WX1]
MKLLSKSLAFIMTVCFVVQLLSANLLVKALNVTATQVSAGANFTAILASDGTVWTWGQNEHGECGNGTVSETSQIAQVAGLTDITMISAGYYFCLALKSDGTVWAWGQNTNGELGIGTTSNYSDVPVQISALTGITQIAGGKYFGMALKADGTLKTWGKNQFGQLGNGSTTDSSSPTQVGGLNNVSYISAGANAGYAVKASQSGIVYSWGNNAYGQLGDGTTIDSNTPIQVINLSGVSKLAGGGNHVLALTTSGAIKAWGANDCVQLGNASWTNSNIPINVANMNDPNSAILISAGANDSFAIDSDGNGFCWGCNDYGALGDGTTDWHMVDNPIANLTNLTQISAGYQHTVALKSDGTVWSWGNNNYRQLGSFIGNYSVIPVQSMDGEEDTTPPTAPTGLTFSSVTDTSVSLAWTAASDDVAVTGYDIYRDGTMVGTTANTTYTDSGLTAETSYSYYVKAKDAANNESTASNTLNVETTAVSGAKVIQVAAGNGFTVVLKDNGTVWVWGRNDFDQCCTGMTSDSEGLTQVTGLTNVTKVAAGLAFCMALKSDGTVWTWGRNWNSELGDGDNYEYSTGIVQVSGLNNVTDIAAGAYHGLALKADGSVYAWGHNADGQLGNGTTNESDTPVQVNSLTGVNSIAAGAFSSYAVKSNGTAWSWGNNESGQLGNGTTNNTTAPVQVSNLTGVKFISAGFDHALALLTNDAVKAWGSNDCVQLGNASWTSSSTPVDVVNMDDPDSAVDISAGAYHSLAIQADGTAVGWGNNDDGMLGDGSEAWHMVPNDVLNLTGLIQISGGYTHSVALTSDGTVWSWGKNDYGQLGGYTGNYSMIPVQSTTSTADTTAPTAPTGLTCSSRTGTTATLTWSSSTDNVGVTGYDVFRDGTKIGKSTITSYTETGLTANTAYTYYVKAKDAAENISEASNTVEITTLSNSVMVQQISAGGYFTAILKSDGTVWAWGQNDFNQCCTGTVSDSETLTQIPGLDNVMQISAGFDFCMALKTDGTVWAWGRNWNSELGDGDNYQFSTAAVQVVGLTNIKEISAGTYHGMALKTDGTVWSWGYNEYGQLGNGSTDESDTAAQISGLSGVKHISCGSYSSYAVKMDGTVWAWGKNDKGQLGDGSIVNKTVPVQVGGLSNVDKVAAGAEHVLALLTTGIVMAWGANEEFQLGNGTSTNSSTPVNVTNLSTEGSAVEIATGDYQSFVIKADRTVVGWGYNDCGLLGDGTEISRSTPVTVSNLSDVTQIDGASYHSVALLEDGTVWSWGRNNCAQLGGSSLEYSTTAVLSKTSDGALSFEFSSYSITKPEADTSSITVSAFGTDAEGNQIAPEEIVYSLQDTYMGVQVDDSTGVVTVSAEAELGTVTLVAMFENITCTATLSIHDAASTTITLSATQNNSYNVAVTGSSISSYSDVTYTVTYDAAVLQISDLCALTYAKETTAGDIAGTGITITSFTPGTIQFIVDKTIPTGTQWSGIIDVFQFVALQTQETTVHIE